MLSRFPTQLLGGPPDDRVRSAVPGTQKSASASQYEATGRHHLLGLVVSHSGDIEVKATRFKISAGSVDLFITFVTQSPSHLHSTGFLSHYMDLAAHGLKALRLL